MEESHNGDDIIYILENVIATFNRGLVLKELLTDQTRKQLLTRDNPNADAFIYWATSDYESYGQGYGAHDEILPELITGNDRGKIIMPRVMKEKHQQNARSKDKAEVFTPSWVCNTQNNLVDDAWFGYSGAFNEEMIDADGNHTWIPTSKVDFSRCNRKWQEYVKDIRMEITCGEAPYLASRYDTTTGQFIPVNKRIGLLDRKLRVVGENAKDRDEWLKYATFAFRSIYGYEWQGDNLLLARESLFLTFIDYHSDRFGDSSSIHANTLMNIAHIISWNIWQMDGIKYVIPETCHDEEVLSTGSLFDTEEVIETRPCEGCRTGNNNLHNGIYPLIRDWNVFDDYHEDKFGRKGKDRCDTPFNKLVK